MLDRTTTEMPGAKVATDERALVLGSMLDTGLGTVLLVEPRAELREQVTLRLLCAGYRVVASGSAAAVARAAIGVEVGAVVVAIDPSDGGAATLPELDLVRFGAPLVALVVGDPAAADAMPLPTGARVVPTNGAIADTEQSVLDVLESLTERRSAPSFSPAGAGRRISRPRAS